MLIWIICSDKAGALTKNKMTITESGKANSKVKRRDR